MITIKNNMFHLATANTSYIFFINNPIPKSENPDSIVQTAP